MAAIRKDLIVCKLGKKSKRGYFFKEQAVRDFIDSETWARRKVDRTALCSITHLSRRKTKDPNNLKAVGSRDYQLVDQTTIGTVIDMFIKDGYWMVTVEFFDPDKFVGSEAYKDITYIHGLLTSGVKPRSSGGIEAYYNPVTMEGETVYDFVGVDLTQAPDFTEGGVI